MCADVPVFRVIYGIHLPKIDSKSPCYLSALREERHHHQQSAFFWLPHRAMHHEKHLIFFPLKNSECQVTDMYYSTLSAYKYVSSTDEKSKVFA